MAQLLPSIREQTFALFKSLGTLILISIAFPISLSIVLVSLLWNYFTNQKKVQAENPKNILLPGAR